MPSGISAFWHNNLFFREGLVASDVVQILFVGRLDRNKNIKSVVAACDQLYQEGVGVELHIVGDGPLKRWLMDKISTVDFIKYAGPLYSNEALMDAYRAAHVLVVPSFKETFGLVYPEALSQGLPIIFSAGEGFDGWFNSGEVGYAVDPYSIESIKVAIVKILSLYGTLSRNATEKSSLFDWGPISNEYNKLYSSLIDGLPI
nr:glycosyltransferase [Desulfuromonas acetoxidans]